MKISSVLGFLIQEVFCLNQGCQRWNMQAVSDLWSEIIQPFVLALGLKWTHTPQTVHTGLRGAPLSPPPPPAQGCCHPLQDLHCMHYLPGASLGPFPQCCAQWCLLWLVQDASPIWYLHWLRQSLWVLDSACGVGVGRRVPMVHSSSPWTGPLPITCSCLTLLI